MVYPKLSDKWRYNSYVNAKDFMAFSNKGKADSITYPKLAVICYSSTILKLCESKYKVSKLGRYKVINYKGIDVILHSCFGIGAPVATVTAEELIALGVNKIISVGLAGGLNKALSVGDYVICDSAYRDEGTSYHYAAPDFRALADQDLTSSLEKSVKNHNKKTLIGASWTTDAPYRETLEEIEHYRDLGTLTVEMEASALFVLASVKKIKCAALFTISDLLFGESWRPMFDHKNIDLLKLTEIALDAITN